MKFTDYQQAIAYARDCSVEVEYQISAFASTDASEYELHNAYDGPLDGDVVEDAGSEAADALSKYLDLMNDLRGLLRAVEDTAEGLEAAQTFAEDYLNEMEDN
jgi:hypothetical protein